MPNQLPTNTHSSRFSRVSLASSDSLFGSDFSVSSYYEMSIIFVPRKYTLSSQEIVRVSSILGTAVPVVYTHSVAAYLGTLPIFWEKVA